jgi:hypothetical protein
MTKVELKTRIQTFALTYMNDIWFQIQQSFNPMPRAVPADRYQKLTIRRKLRLQSR